MLLRKNASKMKLQHENRTFFKGATSFALNAESSMYAGQHDTAIRSHLGIDGRSKINTQIKNSGSRLISDTKKIGEGFSKNSSQLGSREVLDPRDFTKTVLERCNAVKKPTIMKQPMLQKGASIARLCDEHPSYTNAAQKTVYGKKNMFVPQSKEINKGSTILNTESTMVQDLLDGRITGMSAFKGRNKSVNHVTTHQLLQKGTSEFNLEVGGFTGHDGDVPVYKVPTKFPPPPYLPGELDRRAAMAREEDVDSELARLNAQNAYDAELFHYY